MRRTEEEIVSERLLNAEAVAERYGVTVQTARKYMRQMGCGKKKPLRVSESQLRRWDKERESPPVDYLLAMAKYKKAEEMILRQKERGKRK